MTDIQDRCSACSMTRDERHSYQGGCPMRFPEDGCPFHDSNSVRTDEERLAEFIRRAKDLQVLPADFDPVSAKIARIKAAVKDGNLKPISDTNPFTVHLTWEELRQKLIEMDWTPPGPSAESTAVRTDEMPPADIVEAAHKVGRWFAERNITSWVLGPCAARRRSK